ncbi:peptidyl-prolyl cis-trans isomerase-like 3 isoform X2 [Gopherus flavomarginatus]|uniref:peptidyl-prolyl cis-trans isomerase-like 3 isoform X2 n=1 Tax=Gopherus evgoodei TaxID=1825980 RepID=UPI0011CF019F|nr:peptidyl-prolyl cis-trans isomerase-like 3 isoform X2 [Gopherus evgoodei]XP_050772618.1 peptidyl-prolyl cis-trans isomerase-like 3 isoform X2 [Gopherus flavomarginatus]
MAAYFTGISKDSWCRQGIQQVNPSISVWYIEPFFKGGRQGSGKGGNSIWGRKFEDEYSEHLKHSVRGVVSMANNGPNTNGSQFFITYGKQPHLDMKYTVFGKVIDGLETLDELEKLPVNEKTYRPLNDVHIKDVTIHANPLAS